MAVEILVDYGDGRKPFTAYVDMENNWKVDYEPEDRAELEAEYLRRMASIAADTIGYIPDPSNLHAHALVKRFPKSRIMGGLYKVPMARGRFIVY